jgi:hypothetical protein
MRVLLYNIRSKSRKGDWKMTTSDTTENKSLWLSIEENILALDSPGLSKENLEASIQQAAGELDNAGYNVSRHGGNMLRLRWAMNEASKVGRPLLKDFNAAIAAFKLEDVADPYAATRKLIDDLGNTWPELKKAEHRVEVIQFVEQTKLDLLTAKTKDMSGDEGIRLMIEEEVAPDDIISSLGITGEKLDQVNADIQKERAERERVTKLLEAVEGESDEEKVKHLFENNVSEELIIEIARVDQAAINGAKKAMEAELAEKKRLEEEAAAKKAAEAAGPSLDDISPEDMVDHIEAIREIMEFSDQEKEIRVMCEQSSIPKALVDIAVTDPDKLDELEKQAEG